MKSHSQTLGSFSIFAAAIAMAVAPAFAAPQILHSRQAAAYDPKSEVTLQGSVQEIQQIKSDVNLAGTHLIVTTSSGTADVHVGPESFLEANGLKFAIGDWVKVSGAMASLPSGKVLLSRVITKGSQTLTLRTPQGFPMWRAGVRGTPAATTAARIHGGAQ